MRGKIVILTVFLVLVGIGGYIYFKNQNQQSKLSPQSKKTQSSVKDQQGEIREIKMIAKNWVFEPSTIRVKQNDKVRLKIQSIDVVHGFALPAFNINVDLQPGKEEVVEFVADKKGEFSFFCSVFCGQGHQKMRGMLVVE